MPAMKHVQYFRSQVADEALELRNRFFRGSSSPGKAFERIFEELKGSKEFKDDPRRAETLRIHEDKSFVIYLPEDTSALRNNFTIAHELGHYFLHTDLDVPGSVYFMRRGSNRMEWEANWFAAEFLMPQAEFVEVAKENNCIPEFVASHFGVSPSAAQIRMSYLNLI